MINDIWEKLEKDALESKRQDTLSRRLKFDYPTDLFIAYRKSNDSRSLLYILENPDTLDFTLIPKLNGLRIEKLSYPDFMPGRHLLSISLTASEYKKMFSIMVSDITSLFSKEQNEDERVSLIINRISQWQRFLEKQAPEGLSAECQRGLFGELHFFEYLLQNEIKPSRAVLGWYGPKGGDQDYRFDRCFVEVKTTISKQHETIYISSEKQLDTSHLDILFLVHLSISISSQDGNNLNEIVDRIRGILSKDQVSLNEFNIRLLDVGYHEVHRAIYDNPKYGVNSFKAFMVENEFPRIISSDLRNGVGEVKYSINVSECNHFSVEYSILLEKIAG